MRRGQLESQLLILITLGLVAFGLVMVYQRTSAPAALGNGDPMHYLKRQAIYAVIGLVAMVVLVPHAVPPPARARADARRREPRAARGGARRRHVRQRRAPLDRRRPARLPAVRAREAGDRDLGRGLPRAQGAAEDARRARAPDRPARRRLRAPAPARARPRDDDRARPGARRDARRLGRAGAAARRGHRRSPRRSACSRSGSSRTAAPASSASSTRGTTPRARASRPSRR